MPLTRLNDSAFDAQLEGARLRFRIILGGRHQHADTPHALALRARAASGHVAAAPPSSVMNARRFV
jgi:hypothetical protein